MTNLEGLIAKVTSNTTVEASTIALLEGINAELLEAGADPAKMSRLRFRLTAATKALVAAVSANTKPVSPSAAPPKPSEPVYTPSFTEETVPPSHSHTTHAKPHAKSKAHDGHSHSHHR